MLISFQVDPLCLSSHRNPVPARLKPADYCRIHRRREVPYPWSSLQNSRFRVLYLPSIGCCVLLPAILDALRNRLSQSMNNSIKSLGWTVLIIAAAISAQVGREGKIRDQDPLFKEIVRVALISGTLHKRFSSLSE